MVFSAVTTAILYLVLLFPFIYFLINIVLFIGILVYNEGKIFLDTGVLRNTSEIDLDWKEIIYPYSEYKLVYIIVFTYATIKFIIWTITTIRDSYRSKRYLQQRDKELELSRKYNHQRKLLEYKKGLEEYKELVGKDTYVEEDIDYLEEEVNEVEKEVQKEMEKEVDKEIAVRKKPKRPKKVVKRKVTSENEDNEEVKEQEPLTKTERMYREKQERMKREKRRKELELEKERQRKETLEKMNKNFKDNKESIDKVDVKGVFNRDE